MLDNLILIYFFTKKRYIFLQLFYALFVVAFILMGNFNNGQIGASFYFVALTTATPIYFLLKNEKLIYLLPISRRSLFFTLLIYDIILTFIISLLVIPINIFIGNPWIEVIKSLFIIFFIISFITAIYFIRTKFTSVIQILLLLLASSLFFYLPDDLDIFNSRAPLFLAILYPVILVTKYITINKREVK